MRKLMIATAIMMSGLAPKAMAAKIECSTGGNRPIKVYMVVDTISRTLKSLVVYSTDSKGEQKMLDTGKLAGFWMEKGNLKLRCIDDDHGLDSLTLDIQDGKGIVYAPESGRGRTAVECRQDGGTTSW